MDFRVYKRDKYSSPEVLELNNMAYAYLIKINSVSVDMGSLKL